MSSMHLATLPSTSLPSTPTTNLPLRNRPPELNAPLPRIQPFLLQLDGLWALLHDFFAFGQDEFDVARVGHVGVDLLIHTLVSIVPHDG